MAQADLAKFSEETAAELADFARAPTPTISSRLEVLIKQTSLHGLACYPWDHLREVLASKLTLVLEERKNAEGESKFGPGFDIQRDDLVNKLKGFDGCPFTLQRICEMLTEQGAKHYKTVDKFMFAFEKMVSVTSTQDTLSPMDFNVAIEELNDNMFKLLNTPVVLEGKGTSNNAAGNLFNATMPSEQSLFSNGGNDPMIVDS